MDKENQWSEINKDVADIAKKVKSKEKSKSFFNYFESNYGNGATNSSNNGNSILKMCF